MREAVREAAERAGVDKRVSPQTPATVSQLTGWPAVSAYAALLNCCNAITATAFAASERTQTRNFLVPVPSCHYEEAITLQ